MVKIALLGCTGSIGSSTLAVVRAHPDRFQIVLASAHSQAKELFAIAQEFHIQTVVVTKTINPIPVEDIPVGVHVYWGENSLLSMLRSEEYDIAINAISGSAGLQSTIAVLESGHNLALANKESMVMAGQLVNSLVKYKGLQIYPVDSEHSAIFQVLGNHANSEVSRLILTASGGPFRTLPLDEFPSITLEKTLAHPTWSMGAKVTIDSATMMNKALEVIEAHWLFDFPYDNIDAVIHPQSIIHSMIEFKDGSFHAQLSNPSMQLPILYALTHPTHIDSSLVHTDLLSLPDLSFEPIPREKYPLYYLGREAGEAGGFYPIVLNAANEAAVLLYARSYIGYSDLTRLVQEAINKDYSVDLTELSDIIRLNNEVMHSILSQYI